MVDLEGRPVECLRHLAIFAALACPPPDSGPTDTIRARQSWVQQADR
jgi:hypothetical protein